MSDRPSYTLDKLFQQGSERHDFAYNPAAWQAMEQLLEKDRRRRRGLLILLTGGGLVLLVIFVLFVFRPFARAMPQSPQPEPFESSFTDLTDAVTGAEVDSPKDISGAAATESGLAEQQSLETFQQLNTSGQDMPAGTNRDDPRVPESSRQNDAYRSGDGIAQANEKTTGESHAGNYHEAKNAEVSHSGEVPLDLPESARQAERAQYVLPSLAALDHLLYHQRDMPPTFIVLEPVPSGKLISRLPARKHFTLGIMAGGEAVSTGQQNPGAPGVKAGVTAEYMFNDNLSLATGLAFTKKDYPAGAEDYSLPEAIFGGHQPPYEADAACQILEIPLSLSYYFKGQARSGFAVHAGVLSYIMVDEHYVFDYKHWYPGLVEEWSAPTASKDWLQVAEVSVGYRFGVTRSTMLEVAPYAQVPIGSVGSGRVKLKSYGVSVRIQLLKF